MVNSRGDSRLDGVEKATEELNGRVTTLESKLDSLLIEMRAGFASLSPGSKVPPGDDASSENRESNSVSAGNNSTSPMPTFDGTDALAWLARAEQYFLISDTAPEKRVGVAMVALAGAALPWYQLLRKRVPDLSWARFARELMKRFGGNGALDEYEAFAAVRHTGSLADYVAAFEARLAQVPDIASHQYLGFFMAALRPEVRLQMKAAKITTYEDAVELALDIDLLATAHSPKPPAGQSFTPAAMSPAQSSRPGARGPSPATSHLSSTGSSQPGNQRFRSMSQEEYRKHIAAGTCFKCGLKFGPTHRCPPKTLNVLVCEDDDDAFAEEEFEDVELQISELSLNGLDTSKTMKLFGEIDSHRIKVMVDSGASHCFISEQLAKQLQLPITPTKPYSVILGDGTSRQAAGLCRRVPLVLDRESFAVSCYVFPLRNIDVILGVSWLETLGYVLANWQHSSMDFSVDGRPVSIKGDRTLMRRACSTQDLRSLEDGDCCWFLRSVEKESAAVSFGIGTDLSHEATLPDELVHADPPFLPEAVLDRRSIAREGRAVEQVLIKWDGLQKEDASWMDVADVKGQFPYFSLADKAVLGGGAVDTDSGWKIYKRGEREIVWPDVEERES